tara:strand:+ start:871 stop:1164 length:294 start_codon:yes stop_codon:yes gene_type:complete
MAHYKASSANHNTSPMVGKGLASASPFFYAPPPPSGTSLAGEAGKRKKKQASNSAEAKPLWGVSLFLPTALVRAKPGQRKKKQASRLTLLINPLSFL